MHHIFLVKMKTAAPKEKHVPSVNGVNGASAMLIVVKAHVTVNGPISMKIRPYVWTVKRN